ncbi:MAG: ROK family protein [Cyclobacteriaceae bacterium]|nr:ROK family protein [Cyclobacteriaceae bacterium]
MKRVNIGIDLGGTKVFIIADGLEEKATTGIDFKPSELEEVITSFIKKNNLEPTGVGIAVPGLVNDENTIVFCDVLPHFVGWNTKNLLIKYPTTIKIMNDVKAALTQEFYNCKNDFTGGVIMVGTAVGSAFIIDGKPVLGTSGWAGEFGYFPLIINDETKRVDEVCGGSFLAQQLKMTSNQMYELAIRKDERVLKVINKGGYYLGVAIAGIINLLNPSKISIGGGTASLPTYWEGILKGAKQNVIPEFWNDNMITKVKESYKVAALGAIRSLTS